MALTTQPKPVQVAKLIGLAAVPTLHGVEAASAGGFVVGSFVQTDAGGRIVLATGPLTSTAANRTLGIALRAATGAIGADIPIALAGEGVIYEANLMELTAGLHTIAQVDQWRKYAITKATTNWYLNADAEADDGGIIVGFKDPIGTVDGRVYFIVPTAVRGAIEASSGSL